MVKTWWGLATVGLCLTAGAATEAQQRLPADGGRTTSLGQPDEWQWTIGASTGLGRRGGYLSGLAEARAGVYHELLNPVLGLGGVQVEGFGGAYDTRFNAGVRLRLMSPITGIALGLDYNATADQLHPVLTYVHPIRRGGISHNGSVVRVDLMTGHGGSVMFGVEKPAFRRIPVGVNRPTTDRVRLRARRPPDAPIPSLPSLQSALVIARDAAAAVGRLTVPWVDHTGGGGEDSNRGVMARLDSLKRFIAGNGNGGMRTLEAETRSLHNAMARAFSLVLDPADPYGEAPTPRGLEAAERARGIMLREVLLPYNRLLGQIKEDDTTREFAVLARGAFLRWLLVDARVPRPMAEAALSVFSDYLEMAESVRATSRRDWRESRFIWLPLQLALLPEQHDTQAEVDALVAEATRERFTDGNEASYVINDQFQLQLSRTIREARDYHVLLTHDFRGYDAKGDPDEMSFRHVLGSYLAALTARVKEYDSTGKFPTYMILLDEWFYDVNHARLWMSLLEDPTRHQVRFPPRFKSWEDSLRAAQDTLRAAIRASNLLTVQRRQYGERWLQDLVKVHVNITNSADPSFWSWRIAGYFPMPDAWMRDHRKIVFYDLTEEDPYRGEAIFTGAGIGEHYANASWEDRSLLVRGPAVLGLKAAARDVLLKQGMAAGRMPVSLQPRPRAANYDAQVQQRATDPGGHTLRALQLQNGTSFDTKGVNVGKAVMYTLMPAGSVITVPDGLWNGTFWGAALLGGALRGVRVMVIAPSFASAPARAFGSMVRGRELLWRLLAASRTLAPEIAASGGMLKAGVFSSDLRVTDIAGKARALRQTMGEHQWLQDLFGFAPNVYPGLDRIAHMLDSVSAPRDSTRDFESVPGSLLHLKTNFFASREAWTFFAQADWESMVSQFARARLSQVQRTAGDGASFEAPPDALHDVGSDALERWYDELPPSTRERVIFYTVLGSANQNDRSMTLDGEAAFVIAGSPLVPAYLDLISLIGQTRWMDAPSEVDAFLPYHSVMKRRLAHWFKLVF